MIGPVARRSGRRAAAGHGAALAGYALLTVVMTWPLARHVTTAIPGDAFDGWQNYWNLWWLKLALVDRVQNPYVTDLLYAPTGVGLYFHTLNPFNGLLTLPVQLTAGLYAAYNTVVLASWVLPGYGIFLLTRWVLRSAQVTPAARWLGPWLAGVVFTFAPVHMAHLLGHMQVMALEWLPFYALALLRAAERSRDGRPWLRDAGLAGLFLILAALCDWYFALYLFLFTALVIVWAWLTPNDRGVALPLWRRLAAPVAPALVAGVVLALVLAPVLWPMISEATRLTYMVRPPGDLYIYSASLLDFLIPNRLHSLWRETSATWPGNQIAPLSERTIAVGYAALALAAVAVIRLRKGTGLWLAATVVFVLVALGPWPHAGNITWESIPTAMAAGGEWSPYALLNRLVPFMRISRSVSRFAILVQMAVAVLAGMGLAHLIARRRAAAAVLAVGSLAVMLAEFWVAPYPVSPPDTPPIYIEIGRQPGTGSVLNLPMNYDRPGYLLYQTVHRKPLTVAYISRDDPRTLVERVPVLQHWRHLGPDIVADDPGLVGRTVLADLGVEWLVLDRYKMPSGDEREVTTALAGAVVADQTPWYEDDRVTVYHLDAPATAEPYLTLGPNGWGLWQRDSDPPFRAVGPEGAEVSLRHAPAAAVVRVTYRGVGSVTPGSAPVTLAQADAPTTVDVPVAGDRLTFLPEGKLEIVRLELLR